MKGSARLELVQSVAASVNRAQAACAKRNERLAHVITDEQRELFSILFATLRALPEENDDAYADCLEAVMESLVELDVSVAASLSEDPNNPSVRSLYAVIEEIRTVLVAPKKLDKIVGAFFRDLFSAPKAEDFRSDSWIRKTLTDEGSTYDGKVKKLMEAKTVDAVLAKIAIALGIADTDSLDVAKE